MRRFEIDGRGATALERRFPTRDANAPTISRFEARKTPFGHGCHEIVPVEDREIEKFFSYLHANGVKPKVFGPRAAISVSIESRQRITATATQVRAENVGRHGAH
jgi:hypothetical protein